MRLTIKGDLHFLFFYFIERYRRRSVSPWLLFVDQILLPHLIFFSITCTMCTAHPPQAGGIMINRRQLWCKHHLIRETHKYANVANASQRLATYVISILCNKQAASFFSPMFEHSERCTFSLCLYVHVCITVMV